MPDAAEDGLRLRDPMVTEDGDIVAPGSFAIEGRGEGAPWAIPEHEFLRLSLYGRGGPLFCHPLLDVRRLENGFYAGMRVGPDTESG